MFAKLLKHEWKATVGTLGLFSLAGLGVGVMGALVQRAMSVIQQYLQTVDSAQLELLLTMLNTTLMFLFASLLVYVFGVHLFLLYRFYKNKFTDEGYLTFTLPVSAGQIFGAAFVNMLLWSLLSTVVVSVSLTLMVLVGTAKTGLIDTESLKAMWRMFERIFFGDTGLGEFLPLLSLKSMADWLFVLIFSMTCIVLGASMAKKHKLLTAFGLYYGFGFVSGTVVNTVSAFFLVIPLLTEGTDVFTMSYGIQILIQILLGVGCWFLSVGLMKRKLNLP